MTYLPTVTTELCLSGGAFDFEASDAFTRDNAVDILGTATSHQTWVTFQGTAGISSNAAYFSTASPATPGIAALRCLAGGDVQVTVPTFSTAASLVFRLRDKSNYWQLRGEAGVSYTLRSVVAGVVTTVGTWASAPVNGDVLKVRAEGTSITCYVNGTSRISTTSATLQSAAYAGISAEGTADRFDTFSAAFVWTDVSAYVQGVPMVQRGRQHELAQMETGTADVIFNNQDRRFEPGYSGSPYYPFLQPLRRLRLTATWSAVSYSLFVGHVERWPIDYNRMSTDGTVQVTAVDRMSIIGAGLWSDYPDVVLGLTPEAYWRMGAA